MTSPSRGAGDRPLTYRGTYDPDATYLPREVVVYGGVPYLSTAKQLGVAPPSDPVAWLRLGGAERGLIGWQIIHLTLPGALSDGVEVQASAAASTDTFGTPGISLGSSGELNYCNDSLDSVYAVDAQIVVTPTTNAVASDVHQVEFGDGVILGTVQTLIGTSNHRVAFVGETRRSTPSGLYAPTIAVTCTGGTNRAYTFTCNLFVMRFAAA